MIDARCREITRAVKSYDRDLFADRDFSGKIHVMRKTKRCNWQYHEPNWFGILEETSHNVFSLTKNWSQSGEPCDWGIEPICQRLRAIDVWNNDSFMEEFLKEYEEHEAEQKRDRLNSMESFLYDFRSEFKKTFNDINTASLAKIDRRRLKK